MQSRNITASLGRTVLAVVMLCASTQLSFARKEYMDALEARYPAVAPQVLTQKCAVCHGKQKADRSDYAKALAAALGAKNVKNVKVINEALDKVAAEQSEVPDKTYGDLLNGGQLPPPFKPPEKK